MIHVKCCSLCAQNRTKPVPMHRCVILSLGDFFGCFLGEVFGESSTSLKGLISIHELVPIASSPTWLHVQPQWCDNVEGNEHVVRCAIQAIWGMYKYMCFFAEVSNLSSLRCHQLSTRQTSPLSKKYRSVQPCLSSSKVQNLMFPQVCLFFMHSKRPR